MVDIRLVVRGKPTQLREFFGVLGSEIAQKTKRDMAKARLFEEHFGDRTLDYARSGKPVSA